MKRAFTLIEMMVVVAVLVTLMAIVFRLGNIGAESEARTVTITRMQRLENCLSGFHAAFGCYPPVKLHGNTSFDDQEESINWGNEGEAWRWVESICRAQPVGCRFPFSDKFEQAIKDLSDLIKEASGSEEFADVFADETTREWAAAGFMSSSESAVEGRLSSKKNQYLWSEIKLFQYGVMSYLLPRYMVMMGGDPKYYAEGGYAQWTKNNHNPSHPFTGEEVNWSTIFNWVRSYANGMNGKNADIVALESIPAQAACARWMPNLEGMCKCNVDYRVFGVGIKSRGNWRDGGIFDFGTVNGALVSAIRNTCFSPDEGTFDDQYLLDEVTVNDGWGREYFYYSRPPYQSYTLWSAGPDGRTFPPWVSRDKITGTQRDLLVKWTADDIIHLSN
ncbi:MAG: type II secretion system protein GspG [Kiritimatiellae bacterium]|nr:type II secretion system protein GspG [Kiritimatiellia bacterium]